MHYPYKAKKAIPYCTVLPSTSLRLEGLAQASPLRLGEGSKHEAEAPARSRLGETPLAWARCSLAQKHSGSPGRPFVAKIPRRAPVNLA